MNPLNYLNFLFEKFGRRVVFVYLAIFITLVITAIVITLGGDEAPAEEGRLPGVHVESVSTLSGSGSLSLVGQVASVSEVKLESEATGRITRVPVTLGQSVRAGTIIASIENSSEYAAVLQAEGSYEAAMAAAAKSDVGVEDAEAGLTSAKQDALADDRAALASFQSVLYNTVDELFVNPRISPSIRIGTSGRAPSLNQDRLGLQNALKTWENDMALLHDGSDTPRIIAVLDRSISRLNDISAMVNTFLTLLQRQEPDTVFTTAELARLSDEFAAAQSTINTQIAALHSAKTALTRAEEALTSAEISGTGGTVSAANASVKQALGSLRAAQATYNKTIIRTPIGGTINSLSAKAGDYVGQGTFVANIANNNASIITTYISDVDRLRLRLGQEVIINGTASGTVAAIAPGVDPSTKKAKVEIQSDADSLINGASVRIEIPGLEEEAGTSSDSPIVIPVSALKVGSDKVSVFTVSENGTLVAHEIKVGPLQGTHIMVESGLTRDMEIVTDARGLNEGDKINVLD